jgi:hypothetical protein
LLAAPNGAHHRDAHLAFPQPTGLLLARLKRNADGAVSTHSRSSIMEDDLKLDLVDLGDAKELTKGPHGPIKVEDNQSAPYRE